MSVEAADEVRPVAVADILGCWKLAQALEERDGVVRKNPNMGENPIGFLHYLAEGRVAVLLSMEGRPLMSVPNPERRRAPMEELAEAARTFDAYAGRFSLTGPNEIAHHIEVSTFQNDVGQDLVRRIVLRGDTLTLYPTEYQQQGQSIRRWLEWRRMPGA